MECPICGSAEIIWNDKDGEVVCSKCGTVIDNIYYYNRNGDHNTTEVIIIDNSFYKDEIKIKQIRIKKFLRNHISKKTDPYEIILNSMLLDEEYRKIYKLLYEEGILSGLKAKGQIALLVYFRFMHSNKYIDILKKLEIRYELLRKKLKKIGKKRIALLFDKLNDEINGR
ncbi:TFIIB-type zinc ribbon-containing protein [Sulfolobus tengchongensis]|uniref:TFIIB-type zinc ribbon-containing protein n=1 Tax=Sulfolobus tengchongensis TaxID=207809 RepID=A0AAX4L0P5_9CREN